MVGNRPEYDYVTTFELMVEAMLSGRDFLLNKPSEKPEKWLIHIDSLYFPTIGMVKPVKPPILLFDMEMFWPSSAVVGQDGTLLVAFEVQGGREDGALLV